jgi:zinc/manganese transport system permease protein
MDANPSLSWDLVADVRELLRFPFMVHALEAGTIVAVLAAAVGWFVVLRRQSFASHTLSVMAFPGAAGAALAGLPGALGYYLACTAAALAIGATRARGSRASSGESAAIGTVQAAGLALGFLFLSLHRGVLSDLETLLFGTFLGVSESQVLTLLAVAIVVLAALALLARPLLFATIDPQTADARGVPVRSLDVGFLLLLGLAVAATSQITGALLVFALLVAPPAAAQALTARPALGLALSVAFALVVVWIALALAYFSIYPVGFYATTLAFAIYLLARLASWRGRRGEGADWPAARAAATGEQDAMPGARVAATGSADAGLGAS